MVYGKSIDHTRRKDIVKQNIISINDPANKYKVLGLDNHKLNAMPTIAPVVIKTIGCNFNFLVAK